MIAVSIFLTGAAPTASLAEHMFDVLSGWRGPDTPSWPPTMDNELRFYAVLWGAYGLLLLDTARNLAVHSGRVPWLAAIFFLGGVGRALSCLAVGAPHPAFVTLMAIEFALPPVLGLLWVRAYRAAV